MKNPNAPNRTPRAMKARETRRLGASTMRHSAVLSNLAKSRIRPERRRRRLTGLKRRNCGRLKLLARATAPVKIRKSRARRPMRQASSPKQCSEAAFSKEHRILSILGMSLDGEQICREERHHPNAVNRRDRKRHPGTCREI